MKQPESPKTLAEAMWKIRDHDILRVWIARSDVAEINTPDSSGDTPLMHAVQYDWAELVRALLEAGADPNAFHSRNGMSALHRVESEAAASLLLAFGADIEATNRPNGKAIEPGRTPIMFAASYGYVGVVRVLLQAGANLEQRDNRGRSVLLCALESLVASERELFTNQLREVITLLREAGAGVGLNEAVLMSDTEQINTILAAGLSQAEKDEALWWAAMHDEADVVLQMIAAGANVNAPNPRFADATPLCNAAYWGKIAPSNALLRRGADVNARKRYGGTALHTAIEWGYTANAGRVLQALLEAGADINAKTDNGWTPLMVASCRRDPAFLLLLLDYGAGCEIEAVSSFAPEIDGFLGGYTALQYAVRSRYQDMVRLLLQSGANPNNPGRWFDRPDGRLHTPLSLAQSYERCEPSVMAEIIQMLVAAGAQEERPAFTTFPETI